MPFDSPMLRQEEGLERLDTEIYVPLFLSGVEVVPWDPDSGPLE